MKPRQLIRRNLFFGRRINAAVTLSVAIASAVLCGSLFVGDSLSGSVRDLSLARLGLVDHVLVAPDFVRAELVDDLAAHPGVDRVADRLVPFVLTRGTVREIASGATEPDAQVVGIDAQFWALFPGGPALDLQGRDVAINETLARRLELQVGDHVSLACEAYSALPADSIFAHRDAEDVVQRLRLHVVAIIPDRPAGTFSLQRTTEPVASLFVAREWLVGPANLQLPGRVNAVAVVGGDDTEALQAALVDVATIDDHGLRLVEAPARGCLSLESRSMVIDDVVVAAAVDAAAELGWRAESVSVYMATTVTNRSTAGAPIHYVTMAALGPGFDLDFVAGGPGPLEDDAIWLNHWAATDLGAAVGDELRLDAFIPTRDGLTAETSLVFRVSGVVALKGAAADPSLVPEIRGLTEFDDIGDWRPPFPFHRDWVSERDEAYWDEYRAAPKVFITPRRLRSLWAARPGGGGSTTSVRLYPAATESLAASAATIKDLLRARLNPETTGLRFNPVRRQASAAAEGTVDFGVLFISMSFFLVASALGLAGMIARLAMMSRVGDAALMLAIGIAPARIRRLFLAELGIVSVAGILFGVGLASVYAIGMLHALSVWWSGAVGSTSHFGLYLRPASAATGIALAAVATAVPMWNAARWLTADRALAALGRGAAVVTAAEACRARFATGLAAACAILAAALVLASLTAGQPTSQTAFMLAGLSLLVGGLAASSALLCRLRGRRSAALTRRALGVRNAAMHRERSLVGVGLIAFASFVIVATAVNRKSYAETDLDDTRSGTGGFALRAVAALPLHFDFGTPAGRERLGFDSRDEKLFEEVEVISFLVNRGDDVSCLNMTKPLEPRILGVGDDFIRRSGFAFSAGGEADSNPWALLRSNTEAGVPVIGDAASVQWVLHSGLGQAIPLAPTAHPPVELRCVAMLKESIFQSELLMSEANFRRLHPGVKMPRYYLIAAPSDRVVAIARRLREVLGPRGLAVATTGEILNSFIEVQNTYLSMFVVLGGLGLVLGTLGLVGVLLRNALERRREFAVMASMGFRRRFVAGLLLLENNGLLLAGLGIGTAAALLAFVPHILSAEATIHWRALATVLAAVYVVGLSSSLIAAHLTSNMDYLESLRIE